MGLDELLGRLERDADARVAAIEARARAEVATIDAAADQASSQARGQKLAGLRADRRARLDRELAQARHAARRDRLGAEHALLDRVMVRAGTLLLELESNEAYLSTIPERLAEALRFVEGRAARVRCRPTLAPALRGGLEGRADVTIEELATMPPGFSVVATDGSVEVDDTLPARLERLRPRLLIELLAEVQR